MGVIYQIVIAGGNRTYVGSARRFAYRKACHLWMLRDNKHHCIGLARAVKKYGMEAISWLILETVEDDTKLLICEQVWLDRFAGRLYNASPQASSVLGLKKSAEQKERSAKFHRGRKRSDETRARMSHSMKGNTNGRHTRQDLCKRGHLLADDNLYTRSRKGRTERSCKTCALTRAKKWNLKCRTS